MAEKLADLIRRRRLELGLEIKQVAEAMNKSTTLVTNLEQGHMTTAAEDSIRGLAKALELDPDELVLLSGKIPADVQSAIRKYPWLVKAIRDSAQSADRLLKCTVGPGLPHQTLEA